jgi:hypothetical protein
LNYVGPSYPGSIGKWCSKSHASEVLHQIFIGIAIRDMSLRF